MERGNSSVESVRDRLSQWDSKLAPLSERQKQGFIEISSAASYRPLPAEVENKQYSVHAITVFF